MADPQRLVIHHPGDPLFKSIGRNFFAKQLALADWDLALENGANQSIFIVGPPGTTVEKEEEYLHLAEGLTSNLRGYLPHGADVRITDLAARSKMPYFERIEYADRQIVMAATGGLLTIMAQSGTGTLAGGAHNDTLIGLARADAMRISEVFQQQVDREILRAFFPGSLTCILTHQSSKRTKPAKKTNYSARNRKSRGGYVESSKRAVPGSNLWRHS